MGDVYVFFGIPSSGKSYLAKLFAQKLNLPFYETDDDFPAKELKNAKTEDEQVVITDQFYQKIADKTNNLLKNNKGVIVSRTFNKNYLRRLFIDQVNGNINFILVKADPTKLYDAYLKRELKSPLNTGLSKAEIIQRLKEKINSSQRDFEKPNFSYITFKNDFNSLSAKKFVDDLTQRFWQT